MKIYVILRADQYSYNLLGARESVKKAINACEWMNERRGRPVTGKSKLPVLPIYLPWETPDWSKHSDVLRIVEVDLNETLPIA